MSNRKLKRLAQRATKDRMSHKKMVAVVSERTGFLKDDIAQVWKEGLKVVFEAFEEKKGVILPNIGIIYPTIKPARVAMSMNGGIGDPHKMLMEARWVLKFRVSRRAAARMLKIKPTEEEIDDMYID